MRIAQVGPEDLPEERMEPVPGVPEPLDERVLAVQPGKDGFGVGPQGQRVRQLGTETLQDADAQQEVLRLVRSAAQHLGQQEVRDRAAVRLELLQIELRVGALARGQGAQAQSGGPAPGALHEGACGVKRKDQTVQFQQRDGLRRG